MRVARAAFVFWIFLFLAQSAFAAQGAVVVRIVESEADTTQGRTAASPVVVIESVKLVREAMPLRRVPSADAVMASPYELQVLDSSGSLIYSRQFDFTRTIEVPLPEPGSVPENRVSRVALAEPEAVLVIPAMPDASELRVMGANAASRTIAMPRTSGAVEATSPAPAPSQPGTFHIMIMASGYDAGAMAGFQAKAQSMRSYLLSKEPFSSRSSDIIISIYENTANLDCATGCYGIARMLCCNSSQVLAAAAASGLPHDEIIVMHNTATYSGSGYRDGGNYQTDSAASFSTVYDGGYTNSMALHEFGHSFGNLCDEYSYGSEGITYSDCVNCRASCSDWSSVSSACQQGCDAKSSYFRPTDSVMIYLDLEYFNAPSIQNGLIPRLNYFTGGAGDSPQMSPAARFLLLSSRDQAD